jgi:hypothetical protein
MRRVSDTISQETVFPTKALILSMKSRIFCMFDLSKSSHPGRSRMAAR